MLHLHSLDDGKMLTFHHAVPFCDQKRQHLAVHRRLDEAIAARAVERTGTCQQAPHHGLPAVAQHIERHLGPQTVTRIKGGSRTVHSNT